MKKEYCLSEELAEMVSSDCESVRIEAAVAPLLTLSQELELAKDQDFHVRKAIASRPYLNHEVIRYIVSHEKEAEIVSLALRGYEGHELFSELAKNPDYRIRRIAATARNTSELVLLDLSVDPRLVVRRAVVCRSQIPLIVQEKLSRDPSVEIRKDLARHKDLLYSVSEILKEDPEFEVRNIVCS